MVFPYHAVEAWKVTHPSAYVKNGRRLPRFSFWR
jgi:hypothetical protein